MVVAALMMMGAANGEEDRLRGIKYAVAGGLAGSFTADTVKTLRQADPKRFGNALQAMKAIVREAGPLGLYAGVWPAIVLALPSSALYFGTYGIVRRKMLEKWGKEGDTPIRTAITLFAGACGNMASSFVFVPKEFIKQSLQTCKVTAVECSVKSVVSETLHRQGLLGMYAGYTATLSRNIPSAILRFGFYEEIKIALGDRGGILGPDVNRHLLAGALAGALSSICTTPLDVVKTRVATSRLVRSDSLFRHLSTVAAEEGLLSLFSGVQPRVLLSSLFSGIGFASFERFKRLLNVS